MLFYRSLYAACHESSLSDLKMSYKISTLVMTTPVILRLASIYLLY